MIGDNIAMRKAGRRGVILLAIALSPVVQSQYAIADTNPQITPSPESYKAQFEQFKVDKEKYFSDMKSRNEQIRNINQTFKTNCDKANSDFKSAMSAAKGPDQKNAAAVARKNAISVAITNRDSAIAALGAPPVPPTEPAKPMKSGKNKGR